MCIQTETLKDTENKVMVTKEKSVRGGRIN